MSQSSGQVTHVLLTRSRLCPRPKPGSSLHLHVLGTPPAFVLSQDQTLREELLVLLTKSRQEYKPNIRPQRKATVGVGLASWARPWWDGALASTLPEAGWPTASPAQGRRTGVRVHSGLRDARRGQSWHRRPRPTPRGAGVRRRRTSGHTLRPRIRSKGAHAVEFSKTVAPLEEGCPPESGAPETLKADSGADRRV